MDQNLVYYINSEALELNLNDYISNEIPLECGEVKFSVTLESADLKLYEIYQDSDIFTLENQNILRV